MSLFSSDPGKAPVDRAAQLLMDYEQLLHESLKWRADSMRSLANSFDAVRQELERGIDDVITELGRGIHQDHPEERHELGADDGREGA